MPANTEFSFQTYHTKMCHQRKAVQFSHCHIQTGPLPEIHICEWILKPLKWQRQVLSFLSIDSQLTNLFCFPLMYSSSINYRA